MSMTAIIDVVCLLGGWRITLLASRIVSSPTAGENPTRGGIEIPHWPEAGFSRHRSTRAWKFAPNYLSSSSRFAR